jgi:hypothetical protein
LNVVNCELKTVLIFLPVFVLFFPPIPTHAGMSPPHKRALSLFIREKGAQGGIGGGGGRKGQTLAKKLKLFSIPN